MFADYTELTFCSLTISTWLSKDSSTLLSSSWKELNESTWQLSTLMFIEMSRWILLSLQAIYSNHLYWFQVSWHFDCLRSLTSILACDRRISNDLNKLFSRFLKNEILKDLEFIYCQISSWKIKEKSDDFNNFEDATVCSRWLFELIAWYRDDCL